MGAVGPAVGSPAGNGRGAIDTTRRTRVRSLDGLRAVAILLVIGLHTFSWPVNGGVGVDLFFVLSGYLITTILLDEHAANGSISLRAFYARRARRLLPALVVMLVCCLGVAYAIHQPERLSRAALSSLFGLTFTTNIVMVWTSWPHSFGLQHLWSLAEEEQFYLLWPFALLFLAKRRLHIAASVLLLAAVGVVALQLLLAADGAGGARIEFGPDTRSFGVIVGCLLAVVLRTELAHNLTRASRLLAPVAVLVMAFVAWHSFPDVFAGWTAIFAVAAAIVLVRALDPSSWIGAVLAFGPIAYLGRISYGLYLWHYPLLVSAGLYFGSTMVKLEAVGLALLAAIGSHHLVEKPFLRWRPQSSSARRAPVPLQTPRVALVSLYLHREAVS
ncbi:MAG TPA: acyltransferase [Gaiellaceae bacterium]|jgi:peptidoglycan/LPS O-acetylase OafA/YrhL|nr:acyltransferase [Gaiellaceae bacterium]